MSNLEIAGFLVAIVLVAAVAWYGAKALFLRRIRALLDAADRVRGGDFSVRVHLPPGKGELNRLAAAFDEMAEALQQRDAELRHAVLELHSQATTDPLTRLSNRRHLSELLPRELVRARRKDGKVANGKVAVLMIDLDFFKKINDTFGHKAGDLVLTEVGQLLRAGIRGSDIACRYGGEEISLVLSDTALKVATERAESIRMKIKELQITHEGRVIGHHALMPRAGVPSAETGGAVDHQGYPRPFRYSDDRPLYACRRIPQASGA